MPLELRPDSKWWYGRYTDQTGKRICTNLEIMVAGQRPSSLRERSDDIDFERSRAAAQTKLNDFINEAKSKRGAIRMMERLYEIKTGAEVKPILLNTLAAEWAKIPRRRVPSEQYKEQCQAVFNRFAGFVREHYPKVKDFARISPAVARAFLDHERDRGISAKTWNDSLMLLRSACSRLLPQGSVNPFFGIPTRVVEPIFRQPFTPEELNAILAAADRDPQLKPVIITGMCTAMRRGDCCTLKWKDVDLDNRFLNVKTAKTGQTVAIPIFPMLLAELEARKGRGGDYVFPEIAAKYKKTPLNITRRIRRVLADAGFRDPDTRPAGKRGPKRKDRGPIRAAVTVEREGGLNRVSIRDFHSFRVTWVTLALTAGVPLEIVQKVTGHQTTDIVLKHYFQPGREAFRETLQRAMPQLLTNGQKSPKAQIRDILATTNAKRWKADASRIGQLVDAL
jgi:integrase